MSNRGFSGPGGETSTLRQLKVLVAILILSNVGLGIFGFYFLRAVDRKYSILIDRAVPTLNDMQTLTMFSGDALHSTNPTLFGNDPQSRAEMSQRARTALERERELRNSILKREWLSRDTEERLNFQKTGEAFSRGAAEVIGLLESGESAEATRQREQSLRPAFHRYVTSIDKAADVLEAESLRTSDVLTASTASISKMMLGLGSWPLIALGGFLLITALFIIAVLLNVFFRRNEAM